MGAIRVITSDAWYQSFETGSVHHRGDTSTRRTMNNQFFIYLQMLKLLNGFLDNHAEPILNSRYSPTHINQHENYGSNLTLWVKFLIMKTNSLFGGILAPCMSNSGRPVSVREHLITVETRVQYRKQLTTTSYMSHNVKKFVFVLGWGGGVPGSFTTIPHHPQVLNGQYRKTLSQSIHAYV